MFMLFFQGLIIGFAISAPIGPIGLLCIQRTLQDGFKEGLVTGMGAVTADNIYGLMAVFSLTAISSFLISFQFWLRIIGGLFLIYFGLKLCISKSPTRKAKVNRVRSLWQAYITTAIMTFTNPITFFSFVAIFTALGLGGKTMDYLNSTFLVLGILVGSISWWLSLTSGVTFFFKGELSQRSLKLVNRISGGVMLAFSVYALKVIF